MSDEQRATIRGKALEDAELAMRTVVGWRKMLDMCVARDGIGCMGCPYDTAQPCAKPSTTAMLLDAAVLFERYLILWGRKT